MRIDRDDVVRIEFDSRGDNRQGFDRDRADSRDRNDSRDGRRPSGLREREVSVDSWLGWKGHRHRHPRRSVGVLFGRGPCTLGPESAGRSGWRTELAAQ
jgi:hypothetical protein